MQFIYVGLDGFRFPFCYFLSDAFISSQLVTRIWEIINILITYGFKVTFISVDGASTNRAVYNSICTNLCKSIAKNICSLEDQSICLIMDFSHVIKRIRNCIYASGDEPYSRRHLKSASGSIVWKMLYNAYIWDKQNNTVRIHRRLTDEHFHLDSALKMRNHLAENVLNVEMLNLMRCYQFSLHNKVILDAVIELLNVTSTIITIFRSTVPIKDTADERLQQLRTAYHYFDNWKQFIVSNHLNMPQSFITSETMLDMGFLINGFISLCEIHSNKTDMIVPGRINSDIVENLFCQQRALFHGSNINPDASQYR